MAHTRFMISLAKEASEIAGKYFRSGMNVARKADKSLVTIADREIENKIVSMIQEKFPDHAIWGEETGGEISETKPTWVIDPIDGTAQFAAGIPLFGIMVAYLEKANPVTSMICHPITGETWVGKTDKGTKLNMKEVVTNAPKKITEAIVATTSTFLFTPDELAAFDKLRKQAKQTIQGGDCYLYTRLAAGGIGIVMEAGLKPHDFLPLMPIVEGAGGVITDWRGEPLTYKSKGHVLAAANKELHKQSLQVICTPLEDF